MTVGLPFTRRKSSLRMRWRVEEPAFSDASGPEIEGIGLHDAELMMLWPWEVKIVRWRFVYASEPDGYQELSCRRTCGHD